MATNDSALMIPCAIGGDPHIAMAAMLRVPALHRRQTLFGYQMGNLRERESAQIRRRRHWHVHGNRQACGCWQSTRLSSNFNAVGSHTKKGQARWPTPLSLSLGIRVYSAGLRGARGFAGALGAALLLVHSSNSLCAVGRPPRPKARAQATAADMMIAPKAM